MGPTGRWHLPCGSLRICGVPPTPGDPIPPLQPAEIKSVGPVSDVTPFKVHLSWMTISLFQDEGHQASGPAQAGLGLVYSPSSTSLSL